VGSSALIARGLRRFHAYGLRPDTSFAPPGYPRCRTNGGHSGDRPAPYARAMSHTALSTAYYEYGNVDAGRNGVFHEAAHGARRKLRRAESQRAVEGRERSGVEAVCYGRNRRSRRRRGGPDTSFALLGYPRSRKNGGHIEAGLWGNGALKDGAQPSRFIARRATNGAPPSEATRLNGESGRRCGFRDRFGFVTVFKMGSTNGRR